MCIGIIKKLIYVYNVYSFGNIFKGYGVFVNFDMIVIVNDLGLNGKVYYKDFLYFYNVLYLEFIVVLVECEGVNRDG